MRFDSKWEAQRWHELRLMEKAGAISELERQVEYSLDVNGQHIAVYRCDFRYRNDAGDWVVEDAKSPVSATDVFRIKARLLLALHGVDVTCVYRDGKSHSGAKRRPPSRKRRGRK